MSYFTKQALRRYLKGSLEDATRRSLEYMGDFQKLDLTRRPKLKSKIKVYTEKAIEKINE